jgi:Fe-S cluster biogenesis protein NfuA
MSEMEAFESKTLSQKINDIDTVIEENVREFLQRDNGDIELINVEEKNDAIIVYVEYQGACVACPSSGGTLMSIQNTLQRKLSDKIHVVTV